ncbi:MAG: hypothetical protein ACRBFS_02565 [Aureispira sp.]
MITTNKILSSTSTKNLKLIDHWVEGNKINAEQLDLIDPVMKTFLKESKGYTFESGGYGYNGPDFFVFFELDQLRIINNRIEFIKTCNAYQPEGMFCYSIPHKKYALYDSTHRELFLISEMNFDLFTQNPALYINAHWNPLRMRKYGILTLPENMVNAYWEDIVIGNQTNPFLFSAGKSAQKFDLIISNRFGKELEEEAVLHNSNRLGEDSFNDVNGNSIKGTLYQLKEVQLKDAFITEVLLFVVQNPTIRIPSIFGLALLGKTYEWSFNNHENCLYVS